MTAAYYIQSLKLQAHPEGGYFAETYRSAEAISQQALPYRFTGARAFATAIYFLLETHQFSALHRIQADEIWHFYAGRPLDITVIEPTTGELTIIRLGPDPGRNEVFQAVVPAGCWFGSKFTADSATSDLDTEDPNFSLVGCTVAPGFDFADFELADRSALLAQFPQHRAVIEELTN